ncbi:hypothetical protein [Treponema endosymbiont of Eucomonympha sp.]|uniref:hypothetical protein n=1 Tax=Treponema endosymbiont of Eucomonympha sp. TaxID=1580831 RepID=UPI000785D093|nr:hypothetical protein [Treponema endosymbiont of Eucomonympha sp.]
MLQKITDTVDGLGGAGNTQEVYYPDYTGAAGDTVVKDNPDDTAVYRDFFVGEDESSKKEATTTRLLFNMYGVAGLTAENITLIDTDGTGIQKGALSVLDDAAQYYRLAVSGIGGRGFVTVEVTPLAGYKWRPDGNRKAVFIRAPKISARCTGVGADGIAGWKATKTLGLHFSTYQPGILLFTA